MKLKAFALAGFVVAALIALADVSACPHAEAMTDAKSIIAALDDRADVGGEHQCHHNRGPAHQFLVAWVRPAQDLLAASPAPVKHHIASAAPAATHTPEAFAADGRLRRAGLGHGSHADFADILAHNGRLLI